jgi:hypothetical protein
LSGGTFTSIHYPKSTYNQSLAINNYGQIVGRYTLSDGVNHGYLLSSGVYTRIDYPNAAWTLVEGINDLGELVGYWEDTGGTYHGFYAVTQ